MPRTKGALGQKTWDKINLGTHQVVRAGGRRVVVPVPEEKKRREKSLHEVLAEYRFIGQEIKAMRDGKLNTLIISGPTSFGKTHEVLKALDAQIRQRLAGRFQGQIRATGVYKFLYEHQEPHHFAIFDDCDTMFSDPASIAIFKAACERDNRRQRIVRWGTETRMTDEDGMPMPRAFHMQGNVILITNTDFFEAIRNSRSHHEHFKSLINRAQYLNLQLSDQEKRLMVDYAIKKYSLCGKGRRNRTIQRDVTDYIDKYWTKLWSLNYRTVIALADLRRRYGREWEEKARMSHWKPEER